MRRSIVILFLSALALLSGASAASAAPVAPTDASTAAFTEATAASTAAIATCASGYVCIYKGDIADGGTNHPIVYRWYNYGTYNVQNLIGNYTVKNCQTGGARVNLYSGYNGTGSVLHNLGNNCASGAWLNLTPVNSARVYG